MSYFSYKGYIYFTYCYVKIEYVRKTFSKYDIESSFASSLNHISKLPLRTMYPFCQFTLNIYIIFFGKLIQSKWCSCNIELSFNSILKVYSNAIQMARSLISEQISVDPNNNLLFEEDDKKVSVIFISMDNKKSNYF